MKKSTQNRMYDLVTAMDARARNMHMEGVCPGDLDALLRKDQRINIRVTAQEKADIQATATTLGLNLFECLAALHAFASPRLVAPKETLAAVAAEPRAVEAGEWEQIPPTIWRKRYRPDIGGFTHIHHVGRVYRVDHFDDKESMSTRFEHAGAAADA